MWDFLGANQPLIVVALIFIVIIGIGIQRKLSKGKFKQNVQKPRQLKSFFTRVMMFLTIFSGIIAAFGAVNGEMEMEIVFTVMFIVFAVLFYNLISKIYL